MHTKFIISGFNDEKYEITPHLKLVEVTDFMGKKQHNIGVSFTHIEDGAKMPFANFTLNFGEFIGMKNCAYVDTNNCWFADEILETNIAVDARKHIVEPYHSFLRSCLFLTEALIDTLFEDFKF